MSFPGRTQCPACTTWYDPKTCAAECPHDFLPVGKERLHRTLNTHLAIRDKVIIDDDLSIKARVTGLLFREHSYEVEISYIHNGTLVTVWINQWRVTRIEDA